MSSTGEKFVGENVGEKLRELYPDLEFDYVECPEELFDVWDESAIPNEFECKVVNKEGKEVAVARVEVEFNVEEDPISGRKYVVADVANIELKKLEKSETSHPEVVEEKVGKLIKLAKELYFETLEIGVNVAKAYDAPEFGETFFRAAGEVRKALKVFEEWRKIK